MPIFPTGVITLVFTDIEGSSSLWETHRDAFAAVLAEHNSLMRQAAQQWNGVEVKTEGDAFFLVFASASDAVRFAVDAQLALAGRAWQELLPELGELRVRIGMHTGEPIVATHPDGTTDYFGPAVNRAARVGAAGHGGQIVIAASTHDLARAAMPPDISFTDLGTHRLKGVGEDTLWQVCHHELLDRFPPLKTMAGARHNLPPQATPFIGRETELAEWSAMLREPDLRLLTLIGFGGQGKTRLALQLAETVLEDFADGVWWIELEEARDADAMVARIAHELRMNLQPQPSVRDQVINFHRDRNLLLVLDNTEQLPDAAKVVTELLAAAPRLKCLVTTRRALEIRAERRVEVPALPASDAAALFAERAASRVDNFSVTPENQPAIEELCRSLEGVPLAIELAASRITVLSPGEMLDRLGERFRLLQTRAPDLPPRQRALRGAIDWSYDLLNDDDKTLLAQLAVFEGGFSLDAAEAVCDSFDVLEGVTELRRHSLLRTEAGSGGGARNRFSMLESVRAYALEKLDAHSEAQPLRRRHAEYYLSFAELRAGRLRTRDEMAALEEVMTERANTHGALKWVAAAQEGAMAARLALALHEPLYRLGFWDEARSVLQLGLDAVGTGNDKLRCVLKLRLASLAHDIGDVAAAQTGAQAVLETADQAGDTPARAAALNLLGLLATDRQDNDAARVFFEDALRLRATDDHHGRAIALHNLARLAAHAGDGDGDAAHLLYEEALQARRAGGDARGEAETLGNLGVLTQTSGDLGAARGLYLQSLTLRRTLRDRMGIALMLHNLGEIAELQEDYERACVLYTHAGRIFRELGSVHAPVPLGALDKLRETMGAAYAPLEARAQASAWEDWVE